MTIEQEFFEAFKLIECEKCTDKYCMHCGKIHYPTCCGRRPHIKITPEIVLGLEEIISKLKADKFLNGIEWWIPTGTNFYVYMKRSWSNKQKNIEVSGNTRQDALLNICKHPDISLEIQAQVRRLF